MAGRGPAPKDPAIRVRHSKASDIQTVEVERAEQPKLPTFYTIRADGEKVRFSWPAATRQWWKMWAESPLAADFTALDWSELQVTARLHAAFWNGDTKAASELRLRTAKFGATPEDRQRLKIKFVDAFTSTNSPAGVSKLDDYRDL